MDVSTKLKLLCLLFLPFTGCFTTLNAQKKTHNTELQIENENPQVKTLKRKVAIARFTNETQYGKGIFYDKEIFVRIYGFCVDFFARRMQEG